MNSPDSSAGSQPPEPASAFGMRFEDAERAQLAAGAQMTFAERLACLDEMQAQAAMIAGGKIPPRIHDQRHLAERMRADVQSLNG